MEQEYAQYRKAPKDAGFETVSAFHQPFHHCGTMEQTRRGFQTPGIIPPPNGDSRVFLVHAHDSPISVSPSSSRPSNTREIAWGIAPVV